MSATAAAPISHTVTWDPPSEGPRGPALSGLEALRRSLAEGRRRSPISTLMDFDLTGVEHGRVVFEGRPGVQHYNPINIVHGGFAATLMDAALWSAVQSTLEAGQGCTTLDLKVNYFRPITVATGVVTCTARVVNRGGRTAYAEAEVKDAAGKLYAHATSSLMIVTLGA